MLPVERFSSFFRDTDNLWFQKIRESLVKKLIHLQIIKEDYLSLDACPIEGRVKQNNLRIFSRLLSLLMQKPTVKGLRATANLCTIAHITSGCLFCIFCQRTKKEFGLLKVSLQIFNFAKP